MIDMTNKECRFCSGRYKETTINDDRDGVLHCNKCDDKIDRWLKECPNCPGCHCDCE